MEIIIILVLGGLFIYIYFYLLIKLFKKLENYTSKFNYGGGKANGYLESEKNYSVNNETKNEKVIDKNIHNEDKKEEIKITNLEKVIIFFYSLLILITSILMFYGLLSYIDGILVVILLLMAIFLGNILAKRLTNKIKLNNFLIYSNLFFPIIPILGFFSCGYSYQKYILSKERKYLIFSFIGFTLSLIIFIFTLYITIPQLFTYETLVKLNKVMSILALFGGLSANRFYIRTINKISNEK